MKIAVSLVIITALVLGGCQARTDAPSPLARFEVERHVDDRTREQLWEAAVVWLRSEFSAKVMQIDIMERDVGLVMAKVMLREGAVTVVDTPMPLRITVTIEAHAHGYRAVFDGFQLPKRWMGKVPAPGKELDSALHTAQRLEFSLAEHLLASPVNGFPIEH